MVWQPADYLIASPRGPRSVPGYVYRGLGMHVLIRASPKGRRPTLWVLTHLNSGHRVCQISGMVKDAFPLASEIAETGDWDFESLVGYKDRFPDAPKILADIIAKNKRVKRGNVSGSNDPDVAREIAYARMDAV